jgi:hypothetical protein
LRLCFRRGKSNTRQRTSVGHTKARGFAARENRCVPRGLVPLDGGANQFKGDGYDNCITERASKHTLYQKHGATGVRPSRIIARSDECHWYRAAKTLATNVKTAKPTATTAKPAAASAAKQKGNAGAAPQASAQVANSVGLVPAAAQTPIPSPPAAAKPNVAIPSPVPNATVPAATPGASPAAAPPASWSPAVSQEGSSTAAGPASAVTSASSGGNGSRSPVGGLGVGTFLWPGGWTLTAYGCFRTGTRLFCDFDTTNQNNPQAGSNIWSGGGGVNLVDDGGKITARHNAFFVGQDGSQFPTAYISPQPVRFLIEYDDVDPELYLGIAGVRTRVNSRSSHYAHRSKPATGQDASSSGREQWRNFRGQRCHTRNRWNAAGWATRGGCSRQG